MYAVSSSFAAAAIQNNAMWVRKFYIGSSDYSQYVNRYPTISKKWDDLQAQTVTIDLSNAGKTFNFLNANPTLMRTNCSLQLGLSFSGQPPKSSIGLVNSGTAQAATSNTLTLATSAVSSDDYYTPMRIEITGGAGAGQSRTISAYVGITKIATADVPWSSNLQTYSEDATQSSWGKLNGTAGVSSTTINGWPTKRITFGGGAVVHYFYGNTTPVVGGSFAETITIDVTGLVYKFIYMECGGLGATFIWTGPQTIVMTGSVPEKGFIIHGDWQATLYLRNTQATNSYRAIYVGGYSTTNIDGQYVDVTRLSIRTDGVPVPNEYIATGASPVLPPDATSVYEIRDVSDTLTLFAGTIDAARFSDGGCSLTLIDKFKKLSDMKIGDNTSAESYTNSNWYASDFAWHLVTSHGNLSAIASTSNTDIDYGSFSSWHSQMVSDSIYVQGNFTGQTPMEGLRKIATLTQSAIYIENNKLKFNRFSITDSAQLFIDDTILTNVSATLDDRELVNKQWVSGAYDVTSKSFGVTVYDTADPSVSSYGLREELLAENLVWLVNSNSALNLAQRKVITGKEIRSKYQLTTPLNSILSTIGDAVLFRDAQLDVSSGSTFRIMQETLDMENGTKQLQIDASQYFVPFVLDIDSTTGYNTPLDSAAVLT